MLAEGIVWKNVDPLLAELRANGIEANITVGAIRFPIAGTGFPSLENGHGGFPHEFSFFGFCVA